MLFLATMLFEHRKKWTRHLITFTCVDQNASNATACRQMRLSGRQGLSSVGSRSFPVEIRRPGRAAGEHVRIKVDDTVNDRAEQLYVASDCGGDVTHVVMGTAVCFITRERGEKDLHRRFHVQPKRDNVHRTSVYILLYPYLYFFL